jgi:superfamily II DNA or RNA helicase
MARASLRGAPAWRRVLRAIEDREKTDRYGQSLHTLRYDLDLAPAIHGGPIAVHVRATWGSAANPSVHPAHLTRPFVGQAPREDAALLSLLDGVNAAVSTAERYTRIAPLFHVPLAVAPAVLERLAETGRAYVAKAGGETDLTAPAIRWDLGDDYDLVLGVETVAPGTLEVLPFFARGEERIEVGEPLLVLGGTMALFRDRIAAVECGGQAEWAHVARVEGALEVAEGDLPALLEEIHAREQSPRVDLPVERAFSRVKVQARPYVILRTRAAKGIILELGVDYDGVRVHALDLGHALVDRVGKRIIDRDDPLEFDAVAKVEALGARPVAGRYRIAKRELMDTARALLGFGWRVEIDGRLHRRATRLSLGVATGIDWLDVTVDASFDGAPLALPEMLTAIRQHRRSIVLSDGSIGEIPDEWVERLRRWSALAEPTSATLRFTKAQAGLVAALADADAGRDKTVVLDAAFEKARDQLRLFDGLSPRDPPPSFRGTLRDYQKRALGWFAYLRQFGFGGCLADDMGLGKTVQVLALLDQHRAEKAGPSLVVAPRSLLYNWASEAARFAPELRVHIHDGAGRAAGEERFAEHDVVLTTYGLLRKDVEALAKVTFDYVVLDEAQAIKTARSAAARAAHSLVARHKLALTGTPIENHLGELASLLDFLNPGVLGASSALAHLAGGAGGAGGAGSRKIDDESRTLLARGIRPFFLRRTKQEVAPELPARVEQTIYCELEPEHRRHYDDLLAHYRRSLVKRIAQDGFKRSAVQVLEALLRLRQLACHPGLIARDRKGESSAKLDALLEHLASARAEGHKALVFSQFTSLLAIVRARLEAEGVVYEYLDGATADRAKRVERFQSDPACSVFLLSLKAGGVGLNLPAAEYVFLLDPWWNPASEAQAIDRAHRIGQTKTVFAYRLLARGTIEEKVEELQREKRALAEGFFGEKGGAIGGMTREDLERLLG